MEKGTNMTQTFVGEANVTTNNTNKNLKSSPTYFWKNNETVWQNPSELILTEHRQNLNQTVQINEERLFPKEDVVNNPKHYNSEVFPQVIDMMIKTFSLVEVLAFCKLNSFKYRMRCGLKHDEIDKKIADNPRKEKKHLKKRKNLMVQDIEKAIWYENKFTELNLSQTSEKQILKG